MWSFQGRSCPPAQDPLIPSDSDIFPIRHLQFTLSTHKLYSENVYLDHIIYFNGSPELLYLKHYQHYFYRGEAGTEASNIIASYI